jgi:hypothetical protein
VGTPHSPGDRGEDGDAIRSLIGVRPGASMTRKPPTHSFDREIMTHELLAGYH